MPEYLAPGVYVEETSFRQKTIEGVSTSTAAFVGPTRFGPLDGLPALLTNFGDFERIYGGIDSLEFDTGRMPNHLAHGVRAFFDNGGRRCYVSRVSHGGTAGQPSRATGRVGVAGHGLALRARHPGLAGGFEVTLTLRMSANILDPSGPHLRGAEEHQVVWLDELNGTVGQLAYLRDAFDENASEPTYDLRSDPGTGDASLGLVTGLDPSETSDVRILEVDVQVGPLGRFMDAQVWQGLSLHHEHPTSLERVFAADGDRATELFVPLVVEREPNVVDGAALAKLLLDESGATAGLGGTGVKLNLGRAVAGSVDVQFANGGGSHDIEVKVGATRAAIVSALRSEGVDGPQVTRPRPNEYIIATNAAYTVRHTEHLLVRGELAEPRRGTRYVVDTSPSGPFALGVGGGRATQPLISTVSAENATAALTELLGQGQVTVTRDGPQLTITLWGGYDRTLEIIGENTADFVPAPPQDPATPVVRLEISANGGHFEIGRPGQTPTEVEAPQDTTDETMDDVRGEIQAALDTGSPDHPTVTVEDGGFVIALTAGALAAGGVIVTDTGRLTVDAPPGESSRDKIEESLRHRGTAATLKVRLADGSDGKFPDPDAFRGSDGGVRKSGLAALEDLPDVSIVATPGCTARYRDDDLGARQTVGHLIGHCEKMRYRVAVVDAPPGALPREVLDFGGEFDSSHAALYYPWVESYDAVTRRARAFPPSGFVAGIYARSDITRGVHKAPANEIIRGAVGFESTISAAEQELLNPAGVNCLRHLDQRGRRIWGARTMSSDPEWKYVNLRRYFAFLEASIDRGTQWAVFEPNGPRLWDNVQRTVADFLLNEFANNRLLGGTPEEAFFVRCDRTTMTQNDLDNGRLVCVIGVSPLRPAEFVIFRIGQKTLDAPQ